jgi:TRAP-type mannitol/chloroaromatic compound transport system permease small subunit
MDMEHFNLSHLKGIILVLTIIGNTYTSLYWMRREKSSNTGGLPIFAVRWIIFSWASRK